MHVRRLSVLIAVALIAASSPVADAAESQAAGLNEAPPIKRTILRRTEVPNSDYEVIVMLIEVPANTRVGRHTHPGTVLGYVLEGGYTMLIDGAPAQSLTRAESLEVPEGAVHDEYTSDSPATLLAVFTVEKGKPLASPAL